MAVFIRDDLLEESARYIISIAILLENDIHTFLLGDLGCSPSLGGPQGRFASRIAEATPSMDPVLKVPFAPAVAPVIHRGRRPLTLPQNHP